METKRLYTAPAIKCLMYEPYADGPGGGSVKDPGVGEGGGETGEPEEWANTVNVWDEPAEE